MGADNYENLGFQVKIDGATDAVNHLDDIISRLERIQELQKSKTSKISSKSIFEEKKYTQKVAKDTQLLNSTKLAKLTSTVMIARRLGHFFSNAIQESAAYTENLVLFKTAFGETWESQLQWAEELANGYGLARNEVIKFAGTFRELASSIGIVGEAADNVTHIVTNLGYDLSALYNTSVEKAMEKLQSGVFTGQTKPLRYFGVDISQESINKLFETNEALADFSVNARNLSQSDKVLARLLITINSARNSFTTMANEINNLQSQFRIFQGSISDFKLVVGEFIEEPLKQAMIYVNGFVIAMTNVLKAFTPEKEEKKGTIIDETTESAEEAIEAIDELNGRLAGFDKFNVLGQSNATVSNIEITEKLNELIAKEAELYDKEVAEAMKRVKNEAVAISKAMTDWFIVFDDKGKFKEFTDNAKALAVALIALSAVPIFKTLKNSYFLAFASKETGDSIAKIALSAGNLSKTTTILGSAIKFLTGPIGIILAVVGVLYATNEEFRESINGLFSSLAPLLSLAVDLIGQVLKPIIPLLSGLANILGVVLSFVVKVATGIIYVAEVIVGVLLSPIELVIKGISTILVLLETLFNWNWSALGGKLSKLWSNWAIGDIIVGGSKGLGTTIRGYADGGYTNANLIMTHENGKREWVGKAAGSSAIVNDTQMSDIMEVAVAKGVYRALATQANMGGNTATNERIVVKIGEDEVFEAVRRRARREGVGFAKL